MGKGEDIKREKAWGLGKDWLENFTCRDCHAESPTMTGGPAVFMATNGEKESREMRERAT